MDTKRRHGSRAATAAMRDRITARRHGRKAIRGSSPEVAASNKISRTGNRETNRRRSGYTNSSQVFKGVKVHGQLHQPPGDGHSQPVDNAGNERLVRIDRVVDQ